MSDEKTSLTAALRHLAEQERRTPSEHATPGDLAAYHEGTLSEPVEARVREHLAHCKLCSDLLLDLAGFADLAPPPGIPELTDAEVEEDWQKLRRKLGTGAVEEAAEPPVKVMPFRPPEPEPVRIPPRRFPWKYAAAAVLATAVGFSALTLIPTQKLPPKHLHEGSTSRGQESSPRDSALSRQPLVFHYYPESYSRYEGRILRGSNVIWQTPEVVRTSNPSSNDWEVTFEVSEGTLEPGRYRANLYGLGQGPPKLIGSIDFDVNDQ